MSLACRSRTRLRAVAFTRIARERMTLELDRIPASTERALRDGFQTVEPEGPVDYYGSVHCDPAGR